MAVKGSGRVTGTKRHVAYAGSADALLTLARTDEGVSLFLVPKGAAGLTLTYDPGLGAPFGPLHRPDVAPGAYQSPGSIGQRLIAAAPAWERYFSFDARIDYTKQDWWNGLKLYDGSVSARFRIKLAVSCQAVVKAKGNGLLPDTVFRLRVLRGDRHRKRGKHVGEQVHQ